MAQKAVVTGGAGFIGTHLVAGLRKEGFDVVVVDIKETGDVRKLGDLKTAFTGAQYVFHLAALPRVQYSIEHPQETHDTNVGGTLNVLLAARDCGVGRVVFSSSAAVYGDQEVMPLREDMPAEPKSPYGLHKYIGEQYCKLFSGIYGLQTVCLRYSNVYGPGADPNGAYALVVAKFIQQKQAGLPLTICGTGENTRDYVAVQDVVRANLLAATGGSVGRAEVINIGSGKETSVETIAKRIGGEVTHVEARLEPARSVADITRAKKLLGWEPKVAFEDGIAAMIRTV